MCCVVCFALGWKRFYRQIFIAWLAGMPAAQHPVESMVTIACSIPVIHCNYCVSVVAVQDLLSIDNLQWSDILQHARAINVVEIASDDDHEQARGIVDEDLGEVQLVQAEAAEVPEVQPCEALQNVHEVCRNGSS